MAGALAELMSRAREGKLGALMPGARPADERESRAVRQQAEDGRASGQPLVVVVASDATRQQQYEAATILEAYRPGVLVLDQGLPRLALFRLYGAAREDERTPAIQVVFVGQDDN